MSLKSMAQEIITVVEDPMAEEGQVETPFFEIQEDEPTLEAHHEEEAPLQVELNIENPENVELHLPSLPGAPEGTADPKDIIEVSEEDDAKKPDKDDVNDAKSQKNEKWDWAKRGPDGFVVWIKERFDSVPKHSGYNSAGIERALSYLEFLNKEISRAMRLDIDGELDENKVEEVQSKIDEGIERLQERLDKVENTRKGKKRRKKSSSDEDSLIVKEAQKITGVHGIMITVPLLISRIARVCINGMVSAGRDIEDVYGEQVKKYKLNNREQAEVLQLMSDMGYPIRQDRAFLPFEDVDEKVKNNEGVDFAVNYPG